MYLPLPGIAMKVKVKVAQSCRLNATLYSLWNSPSQNTGVGSLSLLQGTFPTQGLNPGFLHYRQILYPLSHKGSHSKTIKLSFLFNSKLSPRFDSAPVYMETELSVTLLNRNLKSY